MQDLYDFIESEHTIRCTSCLNESSVNVPDPDTASEQFHQLGWVATNNQNVYCPDCAAKKLKPKKAK